LFFIFFGRKEEQSTIYRQQGWPSQSATAGQRRRGKGPEESPAKGDAEVQKKSGGSIGDCKPSPVRLESLAYVLHNELPKKLQTDISLTWGQVEIVRWST
jgi:hypothetical protein